MKTKSAAGQKADRFESAAQRLEEQMETQLELLTGAMRGSVTRADAVTEKDDVYGHRRDSHFGQAVKIGAVSAQIVVALGKYAGEFNHNIHVKHSNENVAGESPVKRAPGRIPEVDADGYYHVPRSSAHPPLDRALKEYHAERDAALAAEAAAAAMGEEWDPPSEKSGSNG